MIISFIWNLLAFLTTLSVLITLHEYGHFLVARCCGVKVERFVVGFGPPLWRTVDRHGTEYVLAPILFGGYVKMLDERVQSVALPLRANAFNNRPIWQRATIITAGPVTNFLLALLAYWWIFMAGVPVFPPVIGAVLLDSAAAQAGIVAGLTIKTVAGIETPDWEAVNLSLAAQVGESSVVLEVASAGEAHSQQKRITLRDWQADLQQEAAFESLGMIPQQPEIAPVIQRIEPQSSAEHAELQVGDRIVQLDGKPLVHWQQLVRQVREHPLQPLNLMVERAGGAHSITLIPQQKRLPNGQTVGYLGIRPQIIAPAVHHQVCQRYGPLAALARAGKEVWRLSRLTLWQVGQLFNGKLGLKQLNGPIAIAKGAGSAATSGLLCYLGFLALISINLGIINLLPLPVLDGGHIAFLMLEALTGRPASERLHDVSQRIGALLLMMLMGIALFNDVMRG